VTVSIDFDQADRFLAVLGKNGSTRLRAFSHKSVPPKERRARKFGHDRRDLQSAQEAGLGVYFVVNDGGDNKASIERCLAYFLEFDGIPVDEQWHRVRDSGLPEPGFVIATGGGSLHFYWPLSEPVTDTAQWQADMKRLIAHLGSDPAVNDPSRVMRLPGCWYMDGNGQPVAQVQIIHESTERFTREQIIGCLPTIQPELPRHRPAAPSRIASADRNVERALEQLSLIPRRTPGSNTRDSYLKLFWGLVHILGPEQAAQEMEAHSPAWAEADDLYKLAKDANGSITDGTFFEIAKRDFGVTSPKSDASSGTSTGTGDAPPKKNIDKLSEWEALLEGLVNPTHPLFERNTVRRQIRAATAAADAGLRVTPTQVRSRLIQKQRAIFKTSEEKGVAGGQIASFSEVQWLISNLISCGCLTAVAAFAKVGKTKTLTELVASLIFQQPFMGNPEWMPAPPPPGGHKFILWWTDQPGVNSAQYLKARGLMTPSGELHPQIVKLYTLEDNLCWDDEGMDTLIQITTEHPGAILITDSFYSNVRAAYGSDQEPEAGGALIDISTYCSETTKAHICAFHSPQDRDKLGIEAIRGHGSAKGVPSNGISLHFIDKKDPRTGRWVPDKETPYRRMVIEGRMPYRDLLVELDGAAGTWKVIGNFEQSLAELQTTEGKDQIIKDLTEGQRETLEWVGSANGIWKSPHGVTVRQVAACKVQHLNRQPTDSEVECTRKQLKACVRDTLLSENKVGRESFFSYRKEG
jgi:hypothetical protein